MTLVVGVTGTGTGVGKTIVTAALALTLRSRGVAVDAVKPVATGVSAGDAGEDANLLARATGRSASATVLQTFALPRSPAAAAAHEGRAVDYERLLIDLRRRADAGADVLLIEGVGGILVPLNRVHTIRDLFRSLDAEMIVVGETGLGTINHTLLTCDACTAAGLRLLSVLLTDSQAVDPEFAMENARSIEARVDVEAVHVLPHVPGDAWDVAQGLSRHDSLREVADVATALAARRSRETARALEADRRHVWHPFTQTAEWLDEDRVTVRSGEGCWLVGTDGRRYLDGVASLWANVHGHAHPALDRALHEQAGRIAHSTFLGLTHEPGALLADELCAVAPPGLTRVFYSDSGAAAVEVALRMALLTQRFRGQPQRTKFLSMQEAYHGDTAGSASVGYSEAFHRGLEPLLFDVIRVPPPQLVGETEARRQFERALDLYGASLAGLVIEPRMQGAAGMWPHSDEWLRQVTALARRAGALVVCDEVAVGFGRTGDLFASSGAGLSPDILALGKGISAGYLPLSATLATEEVFDHFTAPYAEGRTLYYGHTYAGNPLACAVARESLRVFEREQTLERARELAALLAERLQGAAGLSAVKEVRQRGTMIGVELQEEEGRPYDPARRVGRQVTLAARREGVIVRPLGDVIVLNPPLVMSRDEAEVMVDVVTEAIRSTVPAEAAALRR